ncbi:hypothetical protein [Simplicispira metamorpha]|uniref:Uncharacterized protein n=1 Tax=Simplicispira metamorpha TaxID=80881 RepID=A0A4R2MX22_9BURK|nr:hypothetical protein [Simplicispira metamorpha]TCP11329.1 hypothetical protein EV674_1452 [Simplicispira metamorpha]
MSYFDENTASKYVEKMLSFVSDKQILNLEPHEIQAGSISQQSGTAKSYCAEKIDDLEKAVNAKAKRAEANDLTFEERLCIAKDYKRLNEADVEDLIRADCDVIRLRGEKSQSSDEITRIARVLDVPAIWLQYGGEVHLPANSHIGVRVGKESFIYRESLYSKTIEFYSNLSENCDPDCAQALVEQQLENDQELSKISRRAGGQWKMVRGALIFVAWVKSEGLHPTCGAWSDEVEAMIAEELSTKTTVYSAWLSLKARCEAIGIFKGKYPSNVELHKLIEKEKPCLH